MSIGRIASLILILIFNLVLGFIYILPFKVSVKKTNFSNETNETTSFFIEKAEKINSSYRNIYRKIVPEIIFPPSLQFSINPKDLCFRGAKIKHKLSLIIFVCTAVSDAKQREAIRNTWGSIASKNNNTDYVRLAFLLGSTKNKQFQEKIEHEANKYSDIIQQNFLDSYQNLTLKSLMLLTWVSKYCPNVQYVLKTDDDMYINVPNLVNTLIHLPVKSNVIYGILFQKAKPNRHLSGKWYVPKYQFDGDTFPDYVSGTAYVMTRDVTPKLLEACATMPFLVMEDVFITGLCASQCNVKRYNVKGFAHWKRPVTGCAFKDTITGHHVTVNDMYKIWWDLQRKPLMCPIRKNKF